MALYHFTASTLSKGTHSAAARWDYNSRAGKYARHEHVLMAFSGNMPSWAQGNPRLFWTAADAYERANGRLCKTVEFSIPHELPREWQIELVKEITEKLTTTLDNQKLSYSGAIHIDGSRGTGKNIHVHYEISERIYDGINRTPETYFKRAATGKTHVENGGSKKTTDLKSKEWLLSARKMYADITNKYLAKYNIKARIDHRSYKEQGIDKIPTIHVGWTYDKHIREAVNKQIRKENEINSQRKKLQTQHDILLLKIDQERKQECLAAEAKVKTDTIEKEQKKPTLTPNAPPLLSKQELDKQLVNFSQQFVKIFGGTNTRAVLKRERWAEHRQSPDPIKRRAADRAYNNLMGMEKQKMRQVEHESSRERGGWTR